MNRDGEVKATRATSFVVVAWIFDADNEPVTQCVCGTSRSGG